jgi:hypothetical protein
MISKIYSTAVVGVEAFEVEIEVHAGWGNTDKIACRLSRVTARQ